MNVTKKFWIAAATCGCLILTAYVSASAQQTGGSTVKSSPSTTVKTDAVAPAKSNAPTTASAQTAPAPATTSTPAATTSPTGTAMPATAASTTTAHTATKSLYDRLGGDKTITPIVGDFIDRAAKDTKVNFTRQGTPKQWKPTTENVASLKHNVAQYFRMATGGPQKYDGQDLKTAHQGMQITSAEFDAMTADLSASLDKFKVAKPEHDDLLKLVGGLKSQIVEQHSVTPTAASSVSSSKK